MSGGTTGLAEKEAVEALRERGRQLFAAKQYQQALAVFLDEQLCGDVVAASNAAEACLRLDNFLSAEQHATRALNLDGSHLKSIGRLSRARAAQGQLASAHHGVLAAAVENRAALHKICADASSQCGHFAEGVFLESTAAGRIGVFAHRKFTVGECIVMEKAVVPWMRDDVWDDTRATKLLAHLRTQQGRDQAHRLDAMFPRTYDEVPLCVPSLQKLRGRVQKLLQGAACNDDEVRESTRLLAAVKLNGHDDGLHGFGTFFNHSCSFNCEVRGVTDMNVYCCRDILPGEELTITYLEAETLDRGVDIRRLSFALGWGVACDCHRCHTDQPLALGAAEIILRRAEWETPDMQWVNETLAPFTDAIAQERNAETRVELFISLLSEASLRWRGVSWQELYVLDWFCKSMLAGMMQVQIAQLVSRNSHAAVDLAVLGVDVLVEMYELRLTVIPECSVVLHATREALIILLPLCIRAGRPASRPGFDSMKKMKLAAARFKTINSTVKSE